jgi:Protein of unknown function (DUF3999)
MKTKIPFVSLFLFLSSLCFGQHQDYRYKRNISGITEQWHQVELPNDIFSKVSRDLSDIRILGITNKNDSIEVPYIMQQARENQTEKIIPFLLINQVKNEKGFYYTLQIPSKLTINQINLEFDQQNFDWRVRLEGSQDQNEWFSILQDYRILSLKNDLAEYDFTRLIFPDARFRYYRILIKTNTSPKLTSSKVMLKESRAGLYKKYPVYSFNRKEEKQFKKTIIDITLLLTVPVSLVKIYVQDTVDYYRPLRIEYVTDSVKTPDGWNYLYAPLQTGTLNSFEKNEFTFESQTCRKLRLVIDNQDNRPLQIDSVNIEGYVHRLITRFDQSATYFLLYGQPKAVKANYDISRFTEKIPTNLLPLEPGEEQLNIAAPSASGALFENKIWLWLLMTLIIITLGWFSFSMMREKK